MWRILLVVLAFLLLVVGLGGWYFFQRVEASKIAVAKAQMKTLEFSAEAYRLQNDKPLPDLKVLLQPDPASKLPYIKDPRALIDPWGNPYQYRNDPDFGPVIWTVTPDKQIISNRRESTLGP